MKTLVNLLGEHPCIIIVNIVLGPVTVHREVLLYINVFACAISCLAPVNYGNWLVAI